MLNHVNSYFIIDKIYFFSLVFLVFIIFRYRTAWIKRQPIGVHFVVPSSGKYTNLKEHIMFWM